jgi:hypothetical protein
VAVLQGRAPGPDGGQADDDGAPAGAQGPRRQAARAHATAGRQRVEHPAEAGRRTRRGGTSPPGGADAVASRTGTCSRGARHPGRGTAARTGYPVDAARFKRFCVPRRRTGCHRSVGVGYFLFSAAGRPP